MTCASTRLFFPCAIAGLHVWQTLANNVHTVSTTRGVAHAPSGTSKTKEQDRCFLFCQKASIARKQAQLSCQNYTWGACRHQAARRPENCKDHLRCTGGTTPGRYRQQSCQRLKLCVSRRAFLHRCFSSWDEDNFVRSLQLPCMWPFCSRSWDHVMIHHLCAWELRLLRVT